LRILLRGDAHHWLMNATEQLIYPCENTNSASHYLIRWRKLSLPLSEFTQRVTAITENIRKFCPACALLI
jgi:hypothetical protein